jgi:uncharacterized membrane protein YsdA (DUF1294 family)/cold shock CspA family protein
MAERGIVVNFHAERGFGFIRLRKEATAVFVHISDVVGRSTLVPGQKVICDVVDTPKGLAAKNVLPGSVESSPLMIFLVVSSILLVAAVLTLRLKLSVPWFLAYLFGINATTFLLYGYDKMIAGGTTLRVPEALLHLLACVGGTPAALAGQAIFRHKTRKMSFQRRFWLIVLLQALLIGGWLWCVDQQPPWIPVSLRFLFPRSN